MPAPARRLPKRSRESDIGPGTSTPPVPKQSRAPLEESTRSRADEVYAQLLWAINDGRFRGGDRVLETEIAEWLKVSRTPVREALRRLESEAVLARGTQGLTVVAMTEAELMELYDLREALEGTAAEFAACNALPSDLRRLRRTLQQQARCADHESGKLAAINREFHLALNASAHNRYLEKMLNNMQDIFLRLRSTTFSMPGRPQQALAEHTRITDAIERGDGRTAAKAAREHIRASRQARMKLNRRVAQDVPAGPGRPPRVWRSE
jgi:DNA-binding GntR family transcriptional regulator